MAAVDTYVMKLIDQLSSRNPQESKQQRGVPWLGRRRVAVESQRRPHWSSGREEGLLQKLIRMAEHGGFKRTTLCLEGHGAACPMINPNQPLFADWHGHMYFFVECHYCVTLTRKYSCACFVFVFLAEIASLIHDFLPIFSYMHVFCFVKKTLFMK